MLLLNLLLFSFLAGNNRHWDQALPLWVTAVAVSWMLPSVGRVESARGT